MILIGQYDSPFTRRIGVALRLYGIPFEHRPWSTFGNAAELQAVNPLMRVPTLVLDDGDVLVDSQAILDYVDGLLPVEKRLFPVEEPARHRALKIAALAGGVSDKAVSLFYEQVMHKGAVSQPWVDRIRSQIGATLAVLEADRAGRKSIWWFGEEFGHADIAVACTLRHAGDAHSGLIDAKAYPALAAHAARMEAMPVFQEISQAFIPPA